jgi:hypothetical protein
MRGFLKRVIILSAVILFTGVFTSSCYDEYIVNPKLNTLDVDDADITATTAKLKGEFLWVGNQKLVEYGIVVSKNNLFNPSLVFVNSAEPAAGVFEIEATGLEPGKFYYYKAFATINTAQIYSQNVKSFTTKTE